jgi:hypothetical protein
MKPGDRVKYVGEDIDELKNQIGKVVSEMSFFGLVYSEKFWEVEFGEHNDKHVCPETSLEVVPSQLQFSFME